MRESTEKIAVQVVCIDASGHLIKTVEIEPGTRISAVLEKSGFFSGRKDLNMSCKAVGIYGCIVSMDTVVQAGDRVEIYASLKSSPEETRRHRIVNSASRLS